MFDTVRKYEHLIHRTNYYQLEKLDFYQQHLDIRLESEGLIKAI